MVTFDLRFRHAMHATTVCDPRDREPVAWEGIGDCELDEPREFSFDKLGGREAEDCSERGGAILRGR